MTKHTLFVCKSCAYSSTQRDYMGQRGGYHLLNQLLRLQSQWPLAAEYTIAPVECLSACNRPCVVAYAAPHKTTLMFGDLPPDPECDGLRPAFGHRHSATGRTVP